MLRWRVLRFRMISHTFSESFCKIANSARFCCETPVDVCHCCYPRGVSWRKRHRPWGTNAKAEVSCFAYNQRQRLPDRTGQFRRETARKLTVDIQIVYADNDAINQSTQILKAIQAAPDDRPNAIVFEPVGGTAFPQVARAAVTAGIGWAVLNRDANYIPNFANIRRRIFRKLRSRGNRPYSGTPVRRFSSQRWFCPLYPGTFGKLRRQRTHHRYAGSQACQYPLIC